MSIYINELLTALLFYSYQMCNSRCMRSIAKVLRECGTVFEMTYISYSILMIRRIAKSRTKNNICERKWRFICETFSREFMRWANKFCWIIAYEFLKYWSLYYFYNWSAKTILSDNLKSFLPLVCCLSMRAKEILVNINKLINFAPQFV